MTRIVSRFFNILYRATGSKISISVSFVDGPCSNPLAEDDTHVRSGKFFLQHGLNQREMKGRAYSVERVGSVGINADSALDTFPRSI